MADVKDIAGLHMPLCYIKVNALRANSAFCKKASTCSTSLQIRITSLCRTNRIALLSHVPGTRRLFYRIPYRPLSSSPTISLIRIRWTRQCSKLHHHFLSRAYIQWRHLQSYRMTALTRDTSRLWDATDVPRRTYHGKQVFRTLIKE